MSEVSAVEQIINLCVNHGTSIIITVYFLYRDWKYQGTLLQTLGEFKNAIKAFQSVLNISSEVLKDE